VDYKRRKKKDPRHRIRLSRNTAKAKMLKISDLHSVYQPHKKSETAEPAVCNQIKKEGRDGLGVIKTGTSEKKALDGGQISRLRGRTLEGKTSRLFGALRPEDDGFGGKERNSHVSAEEGGGTRKKDKTGEDCPS